MAGKLEFELVSPERLLMSKAVEMVVVPGADGNFGVLKGHAPLTSTVRIGTIDVYDDRPTVSERIFVAGGFAEVTPERCTVLAETAIAVSEMTAAAVAQEVKDLEEDLADAKDEAIKAKVAAALEIAKAKQAALAA